MKALVLYARHYSFKGRDDLMVEGSEVYFIPEGASVANQQDERGIAPMKVATSPEAASTVLAEALPAVFEVQTGLQASRGRTKAPEVFITSAAALGDFPVDAFFKTPARSGTRPAESSQAPKA